MAMTAQPDHLSNRNTPEEDHLVHPSCVAVPGNSSQTSNGDTSSTSTHPENHLGQSPPATTPAPQPLDNATGELQTTINAISPPASPSAASIFTHIDAAIPARNHPERSMPLSFLTQPVGPLNLNLDLETQEPSAQRRMGSSLTIISSHLNNMHTTHVGLFRVLGALLVFAGVAFALWQVLEARN